MSKRFVVDNIQRGGWLPRPSGGSTPRIVYTYSGWQDVTTPRGGGVGWGRRVFVFVEAPVEERCADVGVVWRLVVESGSDTLVTAPTTRRWPLVEVLQMATSPRGRRGPCGHCTVCARLLAV